MARLQYRLVRLKLATLGLVPRTRLARITAYLAAIDLFFYVLHGAFLLSGTMPAGVAALSAWVPFLTFWVIIFGFILLMRWVRKRLMWRLRNRLIVTYVFIGVIPVFLIAAIAVIAGYLFAGQFATFVATGDVQAELNKLEASNSVLAADIAGELRTGVPPAKAAEALRGGPHEAEVPRDITFWYKGQPTIVQSGRAADARPIPEPEWLPAEFHGVVLANRGLRLRVARRVPVNKDAVTVISSVPLDKELLQRLTGSLGEVTLYASAVSLADGQESRRFSPSPREPKKKAVSAGNAAQPENIEKVDEATAENISGGTLPSQQRTLDKEFRFATLFTIVDWKSGKPGSILMVVSTRPSLLYGRLFLTLGEFSGAVFQALIGLVVIFAVIELLALFIGVRLTRSMTGSVASLYEATQHINRGDLQHRIEVRSQDQLAALETSFNSMTESLQKLLLEQKEKERIQNELIIAQEVQEQLFPKHVGDLETLDVHGLCRPARTVSGDYYDFLPLGYERLGLAVGDVSGKGISAALLMATIHSAVRAYTLDRSLQAHGIELPLMAAVGAGHPAHAAPVDAANGFSSLAPSELLTLLNRQLYHTTPMEKYATLFLGAYDGLSRTLTYTNAGHLPPMILSADGTMRRLDQGGTVIGLFESVVYEQASVELRRGDIFIAFSDGITEPENEFGEFGEARLVELVMENRALPLDRISEAVTTAVRDWIGGNEQPDDITLVLARAR
jgi:sigma-B regulation protein RsbU (phosphoserine phosphatase)